MTNKISDNTMIIDNIVNTHAQFHHHAKINARFIRIRNVFSTNTENYILRPTEIMLYSCHAKTVIYMSSPKINN